MRDASAKQVPLDDTQSRFPQVDETVAEHLSESSMAHDPFRVRLAGSLGSFEEVELTGGTAASIERAIGFTVGLNPFVLRKVSKAEPPVVYGKVVAGLYDGLCGPHEAYPALQRKS